MGRTKNGRIRPIIKCCFIILIFNSTFLMSIYNLEGQAIEASMEMIKVPVLRTSGLINILQSKNSKKSQITDTFIDPDSNNQYDKQNEILQSRPRFLQLHTSEYQVTYTEEYETPPKLGNDGISDIVVYTKKPLLLDGRFGPGDIWYQRLDSNGVPFGSAFQVTTGDRNDDKPDISGDWIVYLSYENIDYENGRLMAYKISENTHYEIPSYNINPYNLNDIHIAGRIVTWREKESLNPDFSRVLIYDIAWLGSEFHPEVISGGNFPIFDVEIGDRMVVWSELVDEQHFDIVAYDLDNRIRMEIATELEVNERKPQTSGPWIVWQANELGSAATRIKAKNIDTGLVRFVADGIKGNFRPSIDGNLIVYDSMHYDPDTDLEIYVYQLSTYQTFQVTTNPYDQHLCHIFNHRVVYVDRRNGNEDIFVTTLEFLPDPPIADPYIWWEDSLVKHADYGVSILGTWQAEIDFCGYTSMNAESYSWSIISQPYESRAEFDDPSKEGPMLILDKVGFYLISLVVNNGHIDSTPSYVSIQVHETDDFEYQASQTFSDFDTDDSPGIDVWVSMHETTPGETTVEVSTTEPAPPTGFNASGFYYDISTTATFDGPVTISIRYDDTDLTDEEERDLRLYHYEDIEPGPPDWDWVNITILPVDIDNNIISGQCSSLSWFTIGSHGQTPIYTSHDPILITSNIMFGSEGYDFPGEGTHAKPYLIEDLAITHDSEILIHIQDTSVYFIIQNCQLNGVTGNTKGIFLDGVQHGTIEYNDIRNCSHGIYLINTTNNVFSNNLVYNSSLYGIEMWDSSDFNSLVDNTIYNSSFAGIRLRSSFNNTISNNLIFNNTDFGIYMNSAQNITFSDNTISNNSQYGIYIEKSHNNSFSSNWIKKNGKYGFYFYRSLNNSFYQNNVSDNFGVGIKLVRSNETDFVENTVINNQGHGCHLLSSTKNTLCNNTILTNSGNGLLLMRSSANILFNNTISNNSINGINPYSSCNANIIANNTIFNNKRNGIYLYDSKDNVISNNTIFNSSLYGLYVYTSSNNTFTNNLVSNSSYHGIYLYKYAENNTLSNNIVCNNSASGIIASISSSNNTLISNTLYNNTNGIALSGLSNNNTLFNNYVYNNSNDGIPLSSAHNNSISHNVVFNNGRYGIYIHKSHNNSFSSNSMKKNRQYGFLLVESTDNRLWHNNVSVNYRTGILLMSNSHDNDLVNNTVKNNQGHGIHLSVCRRNTFWNNTIQSNYADGFYLAGSPANVLINNTFSHNSGRGVSIYSSNTNLFFNNTIHSNAGNGMILYNSRDNLLSNNTISDSGNYGIFVYTSCNNTFTNNSIYNTAVHGIFLYISANNNTLFNNRIYNNSASGVMISLSSNNNSLSCNTIYNNTNGGIVLGSSNNNTLFNNTIYRNDVGVAFSDSSDNNVVNNSISNNVGHGIFLKDASDNNTLTNNTLSNNAGDGIRLVESDFATISNNEIHDNQGNGIYLETSSGNIISDNIVTFDDPISNSFGFYLSGSHNNTLSGNTVYVTVDIWLHGSLDVYLDSYGFYLSGSHNNTLSGNTVDVYVCVDLSSYSNLDGYLTFYGFYLSGSHNNTLSGNTVYVYVCVDLSSYSNLDGYLTVYGFYLSGGHNNTLSGNTADIGVRVKSQVSGYFYGYPAIYGLYFSGSHNNTLSGNTADIWVNVNDHSYLYGFYLSGSHNNTLLGNTADIGVNIDADTYLYGFYLSGSHNNTLSGNSVVVGFYIVVYRYFDGSLDGYGFYLSGSHNNTLSGNIADGYVSDDFYHYLDSYLYGFYLSGSHNNTLSGNNVELCDWGFYLTGSDYNTLINNTATNNDEDGFYFSTSSTNILMNNTITNNAGDGIHLLESDDTTISNNNITQNQGNGIYLETSSENIIRNNNVTFDHPDSNSFGFYLSGSHNNTLSGNTVDVDVGNYGYFNGFYLSESHNNTLLGNIIDIDVYDYVDTDFYVYGFSLFGSHNNTLSGNTVDVNAWISDYSYLYGFYLSESHNNTLSRNTIDIDVWISDYGYLAVYGFYFSGSHNNTLSGNTIHIAVWFIASDYSYLYGFYLSRSHNNILSGNTIDVYIVVITWISDSSCLNGFYLSGSHNNTLSGNTIDFDIWIGEYSHPETPLAVHGYYLSDSHNNTLSGDNIDVYFDFEGQAPLSIFIYGYLAIYSFYLSGSHNNTLSGNTVYVYVGGRGYNDIFLNDYLAIYGFYLSGGHNNTLSGNTIDFDVFIYIRVSNYIHLYGFYLSGGHNNTLSGNTIDVDVYVYVWVSDSSCLNGFYLSESHNNTLSGNSIDVGGRFDYYRYLYGFYLSGSHNNTLSGNTVEIRESHSWGLHLEGSSHNLIFHNNLIDYVKGVDIDSEYGNYWYHPELLEGNYWSDYIGVDLDGDGIGDTDTPWPEQGYDLYPLVFDSDGDGLSDEAELLIGTDPSNPDSDGDELLDGEEIYYETNPLNPDSDDDGLTDPEELFDYETDPWDGDSDNDGLTDGEEVHIYETLPLSSDTDADGWNDGAEVHYLFTNPLLKGPLYIDSDDDFAAFGFEGTGLEDDPYIIENLVITASTVDLIYIENTQVYFEIYNCILDGQGSEYTGITFSDVWYGSINQTPIQGCQKGIVLSECEYVTVDGNGGVKIQGSADAIVGILLFRCSTVSIKNFFIRNFDTGIDIELSTELDIAVNYVTLNDVGISLAWSSNVKVHNCIIANNDLGVFNGFFSGNNEFYLNLLIGNTIQIQDQSFSSQWWSSELTMGNYWSNYLGRDLNGDGIGDTNLPHEFEDNYPLVDPSIPMGYGGLPVGDDWWQSTTWWIWRGTWSGAAIQVTDPSGNVISVDINEIGVNAFYVEYAEGDSNDVVVIIVWPLATTPSPEEVFSLQMTAQADLTYSMEWFVSYGDVEEEIGGDVLFERTVVDASLAAGETRLVETELIIQPDGVIEVEPIAQYTFGGILRPINEDGSSVFNAGRTIPVKFQLFDGNGLPVETAHAMLEFAFVDEDGTVGAFQPASSAGNANFANIFRSDNTTHQYIYNLDTSNWVSGVYLLRITLDDGQQFTVQITIR